MRKAAVKKKPVSASTRTALFDVTFTVEVEMRLREGTNPWEAVIYAVEDAVTEMVDKARRGPFPYEHKGVTILDAIDFSATFVKELGRE
jgi:hypothetical protein